MKSILLIIFVFSAFMCRLSAQDRTSDLYVYHALGRIVVVSGEISEEVNAGLIDIQYGIQQQRLGVVNIAIDDVLLSFLDSDMAVLFSPHLKNASRGNSIRALAPVVNTGIGGKKEWLFDVGKKLKFNYILVYMPGLTLQDAPRLMLVGKATDAEVDEFKKWERQSHSKKSESLKIVPKALKLAPFRIAPYDYDAPC